MSDTRISALNLGPIPEIEFFLQSPGVTVLVAPNGSGKSILLDAVQAAAKGTGKLPLRDRARKGRVDAFGATITIGGTCRHTGSFEVTHIEGRFDLASLVDPRIKSPSAADRARIKALVALTGVEASPQLFRDHEAFQNFDTVVQAESLSTDDLVEMAAKIKRDYDDAALKCERRAEREYGHASALVPADVDMTEESDAKVLQEAYNEARDELTRLREQAAQAEKNKKQFEAARAVLEELGEDELQEEKEDLTAFVESVDSTVGEIDGQLAALMDEISALKAKREATKQKAVESMDRIMVIDNRLDRIASAKEVVTHQKMSPPPDEEDIQDAEADVALAAAAIEQGVKIREAKEDAKKVQQHRAQAKEYMEMAESYREAGKATDEVLSGCISCEQLRVESDGKSTRLMSDHPIRGTGVPYHDLSDGERWTVAIDIGAAQVGKGGLLVISQVGWEGIDGANRKHIHEYAAEKGVYILTAEASPDPDADRVIIPSTVDGHAIEQPVPAKKPATQTAKRVPAPVPDPEPKKLPPDETPMDLPF
jgi:hypothetical protein